MGMQQSMAGVNETEKDYLAFMVRWLLWGFCLLTESYETINNYHYH